MESAWLSCAGIVDVQRPRARHRHDNALRQAARHRRERGLSGPWKKIRSLRWRPYTRRRIDTVFRIDGGKRLPARRPVSAPGNSFIGSGTAFSAKSKRLRGTIIVIWDEGQGEPWIILTDLPPEEAGASRSQPKATPERSRIASVFRLGMAALSRLLAKGRMRLSVWATPNRGRLSPTE